LLRAYLKQGLFDKARVTATVKHAEKAAALAKELGVSVTTENRQSRAGRGHRVARREAAGGRRSVERNRAGAERKNASDFRRASVPTSYIEQHAGAQVPVIRACPIRHPQ